MNTQEATPITQQGEARAKTFHVVLPDNQVNIYRKGMTVMFPDHPLAIVTRVKGQNVWAIPVPAQEPAPAPAKVDRVLTWVERGAAIYRLLRFGRV